MKINDNLSDAAVLEELGHRIARYRLNRNMTQGALATESGVSTPTVQRLENGQSTQASNLIRILRTLHLLENLDALIPEPAISPLQQARMQGKTRQRASSPRKRQTPTRWTWDTDE
jgi:transcriptional regulator with XRE-family HTH domain